MADAEVLGKKKAPPRRGKKEAISPEAQADIESIKNPPPPPEDPYKRGRDAHELLVAGNNWETVRDEVGFESMGEATLAVQSYLSHVHVMTGDDERQMAKRLELARLDAMWLKWFKAGTDLLDKDAATVMLHISRMRIQLQELDRLDQRAGSSQTIVITRMPGNMAEQLRHQALQQEETRQLERNRERQQIIDVEAQDVVDERVVTH